MFMLLVCVLLPLGLGGVTGPVDDRRGGPVLHDGDEHDRRPRRGQLLHDLHHRRLLLSMTSSTADAGRALYGISRAGMTIKQLGISTATTSRPAR